MLQYNTTISTTHKYNLFYNIKNVKFKYASKKQSSKITKWIKTSSVPFKCGIVSSSTDKNEHLRQSKTSKKKIVSRPITLAT